MKCYGGSDSLSCRLILRHVRVCPCNLRGKPLGPVTEARARIVPESEADHASSIVASNWSTPMRFLERIIERTGVPMVYVAVTPISPST
jgi:uncharacterized protein